MDRYDNDITASLKTLNSDGVILYPTDTVWGLGCDVLSEEGVERIRNIKGRSSGKSMIILVDSSKMFSRYAAISPESAHKHIQTFSKPVTLVVQAREGNVTPSLISPEGYIGIRICSDVFCRTLTKSFGRAIVSTSANKSGEPTPAIFTEIDTKIRNAADYVTEYRRNDMVAAEPSAVVMIDSCGNIKVLRE